MAVRFDLDLDGLSLPHTRPLIGAGIKNHVREWFVGTSLGHIDDSFRAAGFEADESYNPPTSGDRWSRVEQYYHRIAWTDREQIDRYLREVVQPIVARLKAQAETNPDNYWAARYLRELTTVAAPS